MNNRIVFTHDTIGEREWFASKFINYTNLETSSSGKWTKKFPISGCNSELYEIAYSDCQNLRELLFCDLDRTKIFYSQDPELVIQDNKYWCCANDFVSTATYTHFTDKPKFWVIHLARSGTRFVEELLQKFRILHRMHVGVDSSNSVMLDYWRHARLHPEVALVFVYRPLLWETFTSTVLGQHYGYHHGNEFDWSLVKPIEITIDDMLYFESILISTLNFWCNLRSLLPTHSFLLLDGNKMINNYHHLVNHDRVQYNKQQLICNYEQAQTQWYEQFDAATNKMLTNTIAHLSNMNCQQNLDHLL
jgi:hypothetical protein